jgi:transposase-like protein
MRAVDPFGPMRKIPVCPACGSPRVLPPSALDPGQTWRCMECGATWRIVTPGLPHR